jgi:hypothetical protein
MSLIKETIFWTDAEPRPLFATAFYMQILISINFSTWIHLQYEKRPMQNFIFSVFIAKDFLENS